MSEETTKSKSSATSIITQSCLILGSLFLAHELVKRLAKSKKPLLRDSHDPPSHSIKDKNNCVTKLSKSQWDEFLENGYVKIGKTLSDTELSNLQQRINDIMLGKIQYGDKLMMQLDASLKTNINNYDEYHDNNIMKKGQTAGFKGATLNYRKIGEAQFGLECDKLFREFATKPVFEDICRRIYGRHTNIGVYRSMVFNKPPKKKINNNKNVGGGTFLPWHQDGGNWWALDRDPLVFCWTALEDVDEENGCVQVLKKSYKLGILSNEGHMLDKDDVKKYCDSGEYEIENMITKKGETWLVHNWTIHRSGVSQSFTKSRMAFSCNYIDARTKILDPKPKNSGPIGVVGKSFPILFPSPLEK